MLEIIAINILVNANRNNAIGRGRKPGGFVALTWALWIGMEFIGGILGALIGAEPLGIYLMALLFAAIGGIISYQIAKNCKGGEYVSPEQKAVADAVLKSADTLETPGSLEIIRDNGLPVTVNISLNGRWVPSLQNGESISENTDKKHNVLCITDVNGNESQPFIFDMESGGHAEIHFSCINNNNRTFFPIQKK
jgi:hypothetical protein